MAEDRNYEKGHDESSQEKKLGSCRDKVRDGAEKSEGKRALILSPDHFPAPEHASLKPTFRSRLKELVFAYFKSIIATLGTLTAVGLYFFFYDNWDWIADHARMLWWVTQGWFRRLTGI